MYRMCVTLLMAKSLSRKAHVRVKRVPLENEKPNFVVTFREEYERKFNRHLVI